MAVPPVTFPLVAGVRHLQVLVGNNCNLPHSHMWFRRYLGLSLPEVHHFYISIKTMRISWLGRCGWQENIHRASRKVW